MSPLLNYDFVRDSIREVMNELNETIAVNKTLVDMGKMEIDQDYIDDLWNAVELLKNAKDLI